jgi:hypothetical protein
MRAYAAFGLPHRPAFPTVRGTSATAGQGAAAPRPLPNTGEPPRARAPPWRARCGAPFPPHPDGRPPLRSRRPPCQNKLPSTIQAARRPRRSFARRVRHKPPPPSARRRRPSHLARSRAFALRGPFPVRDLSVALSRLRRPPSARGGRRILARAGASPLAVSSRPRPCGRSPPASPTSVRQWRSSHLGPRRGCRPSRSVPVRDLAVALPRLRRFPSASGGRRILAAPGLRPSRSGSRPRPVGRSFPATPPSVRHRRPSHLGRPPLSRLAVRPCGISVRR